MRKKLDTRFPAARIKKIMQADEDVGKIALAVPVLVSKALELFLQDLCDRTHEITLQRGAKTINSLHLKHCVQSHNVFDFLKEVVSKVPDYGHADASAEDRTNTKKRKTAGDENESDDESKKSKTTETSTSSSGRGRGRSRGRGRGRGARAMDKEPDDIELDPPISLPTNTITIPMDNSSELMTRPKDDTVLGGCSSPTIRNFDLNADVTENEGAVTMAAIAHPPTAANDFPPSQVDTAHPPQANADHPAPSLAAPRTADPPSSMSSANPSQSAASAANPSSSVSAPKEFTEWPLSEMDRIAIDPLRFTHINSRLDEQDEDYDEE